MDTYKWKKAFKSDKANYSKFHMQHGIWRLLSLGGYLEAKEPVAQEKMEDGIKIVKLKIRFLCHRK